MAQAIAAGVMPHMRTGWRWQIVGVAGLVVLASSVAGLLAGLR